MVVVSWRLAASLARPEQSLYVILQLTNMLCGVDEAGRGPVIGPMVVAAVMVDDDGELRSLQVKDSKQLKAERREELALRISDMAEVRIEVVGPQDIDANTDGP